MKSDAKISKYLSLYEATCFYMAEQMGVNNIPEGDNYKNMIETATEIFDPCREAMGGPLFCHALYRGPELNAKTSGADPNSDHLRAQAVDMDCDQYQNGDNRKLFMYVLNHLDYDNLIWEKGDDKKPDWVHVSFKPNNRKLLSRKVNGQPMKIHYDPKVSINERLKFLAIPL